MKLSLKLALTLLLVSAAPSPAQYIGSSRPLSRAQTLDSLAAKADTQAVRILQQRVDSDSARIDTLEQRSLADSTRLDSVASASAARDTLLHARVDSVRDNSAASSGGGGVQLWWDLAIGQSADFGYNWVVDPTSQTSFTDSFQLFIDSLVALAALSPDSIATGFVGPGYYPVVDTVLGPTVATTACKRIYIRGSQVGGTGTEFVISQDSSLNIACGPFIPTATKQWDHVTFQNITFSQDSSDCWGIFEIDSITGRSYDDVHFEACKFRNFSKCASNKAYTGVWYFKRGPTFLFTNNASNAAGYTLPDRSTHSGWRFDDCLFQKFNCNLWVQQVSFTRCRFEGFVLQGFKGQIRFATYVWDKCVWDAKPNSNSGYNGPVGYFANAPDSHFIGCIWYDNGSGQYNQLGGAYQFYGDIWYKDCTVIYNHHGNGLAPFHYTNNYTTIHYDNCNFQHRYININESGGTCVNSTFSDSGYIAISSSNCVVSNNIQIESATYMVNITSGADNVVTNNTGEGAGTLINNAGTGTILLNNNVF